MRFSADLLGLNDARACVTGGGGAGDRASGCLWSLAALVPVGRLGKYVGKELGRLARDAPEAIRPWRVGDPIDAVTGAGNNPAWSTVRGRYWKNAAAEAVEGEFSPSNLERMRRGLAPIDPDFGVSMELDHIVPRHLGGGHNIETFVPSGLGNTPTSIPSATTQDPDHELQSARGSCIESRDE